MSHHLFFFAPRHIHCGDGDWARSGAREATTLAKKLKKGDRVEWNSHGGHAEADVVAIAREDGEVSGFEYRASPDDPRYIVETDEGKRAAHKAGTLEKK